jgi:2-polyprenyl-6-methoxyphenol hydroxylase-like FAD-dependent oxidoreductase
MTGSGPSSAAASTATASSRRKGRSSKCGSTVPQLRPHPHAGRAGLVRPGDAAHAVPPTGAKGLNRAIQAVKVPFEELHNHYNPGLHRLPETLAGAGGAIGAGGVCSMMVIH